MHDETLKILKDYVEGRLSHSGWQVWWDTHAVEIEAQCNRFTFLRLKPRGFGGAISVLEQHGITFQSVAGFRHQCGEPLFTALPGETTVAQICAFSESNKFPGWEHIVQDAWIHPGQYCPRGCTAVLWNLKSEP